MLRGLAHAGAWTVVTSAAVALSWFGVHRVLTDNQYAPPRALPIARQAAATASPSASVTPPPPPPPSAPPSSSPSTPPPMSRSRPSTPAPSSDVRAYTVDGGRVALSFAADYATLVSATPDTGWQMQVWKADGWIRVDFGSGKSTSTVYCTWNGHPPSVQTFTTP